MKKFDSKAQSSFELNTFYVTTLILAVVALVVLITFLNPPNIAGTTCSEKLGLFSIDEYSISANKIDFVLTNKTGFDVNNMDFNILGEARGGLRDQTLQKGKSRTFTINTINGTSIIDQFEVIIDLNYDTIRGLNNNRASAACRGRL